MRDRHCSHCGAAFAIDAAWPRTCGACRAVSYRNPAPVAVVIVPVCEDGDGDEPSAVLVIRRGLADGLGALALPGGYIDFGETWQEACARELREEAGVVISAADVSLFDVASAHPGVLIVFGCAPAVQAASLPDFVPSAEVLERRTVRGPTTLAFSLHTAALARWFERRR